MVVLLGAGREILLVVLTFLLRRKNWPDCRAAKHGFGVAGDGRQDLMLP